MRLKLDENIDVRLLKLPTDRGHDATTVHGEGVSVPAGPASESSASTGEYNG